MNAKSWKIKKITRIDNQSTIHFQNFGRKEKRYFLSSQQSTYFKNFRWLDSNLDPLVMEATIGHNHSSMFKIT